MMALRSVKASVDAAIRNNELQKAGKALLERLDLENRVAVEALGDLLLFDYVDTTVTGFSAKVSKLFVCNLVIHLLILSVSIASL